MRESFRLFWAALAQAIAVISDLIAATGALARVARSEAESFEAESKLLSEQRLAALRDGNSPD